MKSASENASQAAVEARSQGNRAQQVIFIVAAYIASTRLGGLGEVLRSDDPRPPGELLRLVAFGHGPRLAACGALLHASLTLLELGSEQRKSAGQGEPSFTRSSDLRGKRAWAINHQRPSTDTLKGSGRSLLPLAFCRICNLA